MQVWPEQEPNIFVYDLKSLMHVVSYETLKNILEEEYGITEFGIENVGTKYLPIIRFKSSEDCLAFTLKYGHKYRLRQQ